MCKRLDSLLIAAVVSGVMAVNSSGRAQSTNSVSTTNATSSASITAPSMSLQQRRFGAGVILGEPTGFSAKYWLTDKTAVDGAAAWSFEDGGAFHLHGDFLWHLFDLFPVNQGELPLYFGVGGRVKFAGGHDTRAGVRFPVGIAYLFPNAPVEVFGEVAPIMDVTPSTSFRMNGGVGVRYYF